MIPTRIAVCALALLAACQRPAEPAESPAAPAAPVVPTQQAAPAPTPAPISPADEAAAFRTAWGAPPPVAWRDQDAGANDEAMTYTKATLVPLDADRFALVSEGQGGEGHVSSGALAIHYLTRTPAGFVRMGAWPNLVPGGTWGNPPEWSVRTDLTPAPALVTSAGGVWQGYACSWSNVIELTRDQPWVRAEAIPVGYSSGGARGDEGQTMEAAIEPDLKGQSFSVRYSGARTAKIRYVLQGQTYQATTRPDLLTC